MKTKHFLYGGVCLGIATALLRIVQYTSAIDEQGFYRAGSLSSFLSGCLVGLMLVGCVWSLLAKARQKEQVTAEALLPHGAADLLFWGLALASAAFGIYRIYLAATHGSLDFNLPGSIPQPSYYFGEPTLDWPGALVGGLSLLGAIGWVVLCYRRETGFMLLPILQLGAIIIDYFWATYQFIHVSGYILMTLGLCVLLLCTVSLAKASVGAVCTRGRLAGFSVLAVCTLPACFTDAFFHPTLPNLLLAVLAFLFYALAIFILLQLDKPTPLPQEEAEAPDLSALNQYFSEIPEEEQNDEENR